MQRHVLNLKAWHLFVHSIHTTHVLWIFAHKELAILSADIEADNYSIIWFMPLMEVCPHPGRNSKKRV